VDDVPRGTMDEVRSHVRLDPPFFSRLGRPIDCSASSSNPMMEGPWCDSEEKHEPASDIDTARVDSLKALDPKRPIREADIGRSSAPAACDAIDLEPTCR
jgi:hypothetical protein